jgi:hypothetical protein
MNWKRELSLLEAIEGFSKLDYQNAEIEEPALGNANGSSSTHSSLPSQPTVTPTADNDIPLPEPTTVVLQNVSKASEDGYYNDRNNTSKGLNGMAVNCDASTSQFPFTCRFLILENPSSTSTIAPDTNSIYYINKEQDYTNKKQEYHVYSSEKDDETPHATMICLLNVGSLLEHCKKINLLHAVLEKFEFTTLPNKLYTNIHPSLSSFFSPDMCLGVDLSQNENYRIVFALGRVKSPYSIFCCFQKTLT